MSEARLLNIGDVERYETKLHQCAHNGRPFTASWGEIKSFLLTIRSLLDWQSDAQEREAAVCPEDVSFDEYIRVLERRLAESPVPAATVAPQQSDWLLDCPMCNAPKSFAIDSNDDAVGFCLAERRNWRIIDTTCSTDGCFQPKATFGDLCMGCLAKAVDSQ